MTFHFHISLLLFACTFSFTLTFAFPFITIPTAHWRHNFRQISPRVTTVVTHHTARHKARDTGQTRKASRACVWLKTAWSALCSSSQAQIPMDCSSVVQLQQALWIFLRQLVRRRRTLAYICRSALRTSRFHTIGHTIGEAIGRHSVGTKAWKMRAFVMRCPERIIRRIGREGVSSFALLWLRNEAFPERTT